VLACGTEACFGVVVCSDIAVMCGERTIRRMPNTMVVKILIFCTYIRMAVYVLCVGFRNDELAASPSIALRYNDKRK